MKYKIAIGAILFSFVSFVPAYAVDCPYGSYNYTNPQTHTPATWCYTQVESNAYQAWYQSIVGIPVWSPPIMGDGSKPTPPSGYWVYPWQLPKQPVPIEVQAILNNTYQPMPVVTPTPVVTQSVITPAPIVKPIQITTSQINTTSILNQLLALLQSLIAQLGGR